MSAKAIVGILCLILAVIAMIAGITSVMKDPAISDSSGLGVSRAVGSFLPAVLLLIVGLFLLQRPKGKS